MPKYKYIYGPVPSWRLGSSLGIDLLSQGEKVCNFDCVYCQLGPADKYTIERKEYVPAGEVIEELKKLPDISIDYITFSGRGEPALAANLGEAINQVKAVRKEPIAVLTNSSLMGMNEVRKELAQADFVAVKLDACSLKSLRQINKPAAGIEFDGILNGIKNFKSIFHGRLALQIMFIASGYIEDNTQDIEKYICMANHISPDEVQINTPLRPCGIRPVPKDEILPIKDIFVSSCKGIEIVSVYDYRARKDILSISDEDTLKRRGKTKK